MRWHKLGALGQIRLVQRRDPGEIVGGNLEFGLEPGEFGLGLPEQGAVAGGHGPIGGGRREQAENRTEDQDEQGTSHGWALAWK